MNHIYKLKFDKQLLELIVVSELVTNTLARTHLVTLSEDNTHHVSNNIASSIYSCSLAELIFSMASVTYSLEHTVNSLFSYYSTVNSSSKLKSLNSFYNFKAKFTAINTTDYHFTLRNLLALSLLVASVGVTTNVLASPTVYGTHGQEGTVVSGTVSSVTNGLVTTITNTPNAIIDWKQFNINQNEILKFVQKTVDSAVLNRVLGNQVSKILGTLQSNGQVFIVNPNGIVFGNKSHVDVGGLVASTFDINNNDFLHGHYVFNKDKDQAIAKVLNSGVIKIKDDGSLALIGGQVVNNGVLEAKHGTVFLLAGNSIEIADLHNPLVSYKVTAKNKAVNLGRVLGQNAVLLGNQVLNGKASKYTAGTFADVIGSEDTSANQASINADGQVVLFGGSQADTLQSTDQANDQVVGKRNGVVVNNGKINVSNAHGKAGKVQVLGDTVVLDANSKIYATGRTGGEVLIGGDAAGKGTFKLAHQTYLDQNQLIDLSAEKQAGHAVVWADQIHLDGNFKATSVNSDGGFIETSGHVIDFGNKNFNVNLESEHSQAGTWLVDPDHIAVVNASNLDARKAVDLATAGGQYDFQDPSDWDVSQSTTSTLSSTVKEKAGTTYIKDSVLSKQLTGKKVELEAKYGIDFDHAKVQMNSVTSPDVANSTLLLKANTYDKTKNSSISFNNSTFTGDSVNILVEKDNKVPVYIYNSTFTNTNSDNQEGSLVVEALSTDKDLASNFVVSNSTFTGFNKGIFLNKDLNNVTIVDSTIDSNTHGDVKVINGVASNIKFVNSTVKVRSLEFNATFEGLSNITIDKSKLTTDKDFRLVSNNLDLTNSTINSQQDHISFRVKQYSKLTNVTLDAQRSVFINSVDFITKYETPFNDIGDTVNLNKVNITSKSDRSQIFGHKINIDNSYIKSTGQNSIATAFGTSTVPLASDYINIDNSTITSTQDRLSLRNEAETKDGKRTTIEINNSKLNSFGGFFVSDKSKVILENSTVLAENKTSSSVNFEITNLELSNVTIDTPDNIVIVKNDISNPNSFSKNGYSADINSSNLNSQSVIYISLEKGDPRYEDSQKKYSLRINNSNLSAKYPVYLNTSKLIDIENSHITSTEQSIFLNYTNLVDNSNTIVNNTTLNSAKDIFFNRNKGHLISNNLTLVANTGNISINTNATYLTDVNFNSDQKISIFSDYYNSTIMGNSSLVAKGNIDLTTNRGHVILKGKLNKRVLVNSTAGNVKLAAKGYVSSENATIIGNQIDASGFSMSIDDSSVITSRIGDLNFSIDKSFISIKDAKLVSNHDINLKSASDINVKGSSSITANGNIRIENHRGIILDGNFNTGSKNKHVVINSTAGDVLFSSVHSSPSLSSSFDIHNTSINGNNIIINTDYSVCTSLSNFTTSVGDINLIGQGVQIGKNTNIKAQNDVNIKDITSSNGNLYKSLKIDTSSISTESGTVNLISVNSINLSHSKILANANNIDSKVEIKAPTTNLKDISVVGYNISLLTSDIDTGTITLDDANLNATNSLSAIAFSDVTINNSTLVGNGNNGVVLTTQGNVILTGNTINSSAGGLSVTTQKAFTVSNNTINVAKLIHVLGSKNSLVENNTFNSSKGLNLSTSTGTGTISVGKNEYNEDKPIKINCENSNPVNWMNGKNGKDYQDYLVCHPELVVSIPRHDGSNNNDGLGHGNSDHNDLSDRSLNNNNGLSIVTQYIADNIFYSYNDNKELTNILGNLNITNSNDLGNIQVVLGSDKNELDAFGTCRPKFISLVNKYHIAISDIRFNSSDVLARKYKLTLEQAQFLLNCLSSNVSYFDSLYNK